MHLPTLRSRFLQFLFVLAALGGLAPAQAQNAMVRLHTTQGPIDLALLGSEAPLTVANFLAYVHGGDYTNVFFHRSIRSFVIQSGGYRWPEGGACCPEVTSRGRVLNEFSPARPNVRGTVAMAKLPGDPNSATSQWFINMSDNSANLDTQNGGFTVFARVTAPGMAVADRISALTILTTTVFPELPVANWVSGSTSVQRSNMVLITQATELPVAQTSDERIFNYLEAAYPQYLSPSRGEAGQAQGYTFRYYGGSNAYVGTKDGNVWYLVPAIDGEVHLLGSVAEWLDNAQAAGY